MPRAYLADLRERVLRACARGRLSRARIAGLCGVGATTLFRWQQQFRADGRQAAKPPRVGPAPQLDAAALAALRALVAEANDLTLAEYADRLAERSGVRVSDATVCRALRRLGLVRKKAFARPRRTGPISSRSGRRGAPSWPRSTPTAWSFSTRAGSIPG